jgi:membrane associated rhomboid family serine protease
VLELRAADLSRLHDADARRDALPRVLQADHAGPHAALAEHDDDERDGRLIIVNVLMFLASGRFAIGSGGGASQLYLNLGLFGPAVADGEIWRLASSGFLHSGLLHVGFNMYLLYMLGQMLEPELGPRRFALLYLAALLAGSAGALALEPEALTVGASGAVFGLMGAAFVELRSRGVDPFQTFIGPLILLNLVISFVIPNISIGGHVGGLIGGAIAALVLIASSAGACRPGARIRARRPGAGLRRARPAFAGASA